MLCFTPLILQYSFLITICVRCLSISTSTSHAKDLSTNVDCSLVHVPDLVDDIFVGNKNDVSDYVAMNVKHSLSNSNSSSINHSNCFQWQPSSKVIFYHTTSLYPF